MFSWVALENRVNFQVRHTRVQDLSFFWQAEAVLHHHYLHLAVSQRLLGPATSYNIDKKIRNNMTLTLKTRQQNRNNKRTDTNARGFWLVRRTFGWKNFIPENFLKINRYFTLTSYCNKIGQSNNAFSILGFSLAGKRRVRVLIFSSLG